MSLLSTATPETVRRNTNTEEMSPSNNGSVEAQTLSVGREVSVSWHTPSESIDVFYASVPDRPHKHSPGSQAFEYLP